jgi:hypothetical protein
MKQLGSQIAKQIYRPVLIFVFGGLLVFPKACSFFFTRKIAKPSGFSSRQNSSQ